MKSIPGNINTMFRFTGLRGGGEKSNHIATISKNMDPDRDIKKITNGLYLDRTTPRAL